MTKIYDWLQRNDPFQKSRAEGHEHVLLKTCSCPSALAYIVKTTLSMLSKKKTLVEIFNFH